MKIIEKIKAKTNPEYGCIPEHRPVKEIIEYGIVNIDKPKGPTSHQVSDYVQKILGINKAGHSGTLDPAVTGVLPVALGRSTRIVQTMLPAGKEYVAIMHLHHDVDEDKIREVFKEFTGKIRQLPPIKSAVRRRERTREIYYIEILEIDGKDVLFKMGCQAGTYVRKYLHDIGQKLCVGAHMAQLRRTKAGVFDESTLVTLQDLADAFYYYKKGDESLIRKYIQPVEAAITHLPKIWVLDTTVDSLTHGANLNNPGIAKFESGIKKDDMVAILTLKNELVCLGTAKATSQRMKKEKGVAVSPSKVFMKSDIYPKREVSDIPTI